MKKTAMVPFVSMLRSLGDALDRGAWLLVWPALLVSLATACVLWFMSEALSTRSETARQQVLDAYRGQLRLARSRVDAHWRAHAASLNGSGDPEQRFARLVLDGSADGAVLLGRHGAPIYPDRSIANGEGAAGLVEPSAIARRRGNGDAASAIDDFAARLNDYSSSMPASERLMRMGRLRERAPNVWLPTEAALRLSSDVLHAGMPATEPGVFRPVAVRDVWALASADGQTVALYRTGRIEAMMHDLLHDVTPAGVRFMTLPPGAGADREAIAAGASLPGWQLSFQPIDMTAFDNAATRETVAYLSVAGFGIAVMVLVGAAGGRRLWRHMRVAGLKTDLVASVSHELRAPVTSMQVLIDGLLEDEAPDPVKTRQYLELVAAQNARLGRLIESFLTFSRLERGRPQFVLQSAPPSAIVATALQAVRDRMTAAGELRVEIEPGLPPVMADAEALATALVNLIDNALKYTPDDKRIAVRAARAGNGFVAFSVEDNGCGIPARERARIFRPFHRVDRRLSQDTSGVGLGLSIVDSIVRAHGGTVTFRSAPGAGTTFVIEVPHAEGAAA